jgi:hypothetical protein
MMDPSRFLLLFFCLSSSLSAQPAIEWQKTFGGSLADQAFSVNQTTDGGYIVAGTTSSINGDVFGNHGVLDFWVLKLTKTGAIQWKKTYGGSDVEAPLEIQQTSDGGYIAAGYTRSNNWDVSGNHGDYDAWVLKLNSAGAIQWQRCLGGSGWEEAWSVQQTSDGGYIIAGRSTSPDGDVTVNHGFFDFWVVKLNQDGEIEWQRSLGGSDEDIGYAIVQTSDGGYIVAGSSSSVDGNVTGNHGGLDYWVVKLNFEGKIEWEKSLGGSSLDRANDIQQARDGGYIILGQSYSNNGDATGNHGNNDFWVVKLNVFGDLIWQKSLGGSNDDYGRSIFQTDDNGYVMVGRTQSNDGDVIGNDGGADLWLVKLSEFGDFEWQKSFGGTKAETGHSVQQTSDGGFILTGQAKSNNGDLTENQGSDDYWVIKLSPESSPTTTPISTPITIYPNPAQNTITLSLPTQEPDVFVTITDLLGRELKSQMVRIALDGTVKLDVATLPKGMYLVSATTPSGQVFFGKVLKKE